MSDCIQYKGPAKLTGQSIGNIVIETKGDITVTKKRELTPVSTDQSGVLDQRLKSIVHEISFTPSGTLAEAAALITPYMALLNGQKILGSVTRVISSIATASGGTRSTLTFSTPYTVYVGQLITISGSNVAGYNGTWEVVAVVSTTQVTIAKSFISTATGNCVIPNCLVIHPLAQYAGSIESVIVYQNAGITSLPDLIISTTDTLLGAVTLSAVPHPLADNTVANSLVNSYDWVAPAGSMAQYSDGTSILTAPPRVRFGPFSVNAFTTSDTLPAPWNDFCTGGGVRIAFQLTLEADETDCCGIVNWTFGGVGATATLMPVGSLFTEETIQNQLEEQGTNALLRGQSLSKNASRELLILLGGTVSTISLRNAVLSQGQNAFGTKAPRAGDLTFLSVRRVASGVLQPLLVITP